jgi:Putative Actinobacterial Holin-X, holin superfamily III
MAAVTSTQQFGNGRGRASDEVPSIPLSPDLPPERADQSIGYLVREASTHLSTLFRSEVELAKAEVAAEVRKGIRGSVYFIVALSILIFSLFFLFFTVAEILAIWLPRSAAFGIVVVLMLLSTMLFALLGYLRMRSIRKPERTINSVRDTAALAKRFQPEQAEADDSAPLGPRAPLGPTD